MHESMTSEINCRDDANTCALLGTFVWYSITPPIFLSGKKRGYNPKNFHWWSENLHLWMGTKLFFFLAS